MQGASSWRGKKLHRRLQKQTKGVSSTKLRLAACCFASNTTSWQRQLLFLLFGWGSAGESPAQGPALLASLLEAMLQAVVRCGFDIVALITSC